MGSSIGLHGAIYLSLPRMIESGRPAMVFEDDYRGGMFLASGAFSALS